MDNFEHVAEMEIKINNKQYDLKTGNSDFYNFLGDRHYSTFDSLLAVESQAEFKKAVARGFYDKPFAIKMRADNGELCDMICRIAKQDDPECTLVRLWKLSELVARHLEGERSRLEADALLSHYDCVYYSYDKSTNTITCYRYDDDEKENLCELELGEFESEAAKRLPEDARESVLKFASNLKNSIRSFMGTFPRGDEDVLVFSGTAIYDDDVHVKTVGNFGSGGANPIREIVHKDQLTGLALKEDITNFGKHIIGDLNQKAFIAIIDIDDFKYVNDNHGHAMGDVVLKKCASIIESETGSYAKAGRIGGDEFFVVFDAVPDKETLRNVLRSIKNNIADAYVDERDGFHVTTSIGVSEYPQDAEDFDALFRLTDYMLYRAKHKGKNRYIIYEKEKHGSVEEILRSGIANESISGRKGLSKAEVVCRIADTVLSGKNYPPDNIIRDIVDYFGVERVILYNKDEKTAEAQRGSKVLDSDVVAETVDYLFDEGIQEHTQAGAMVVNNVKTFEMKNPELYEKLSRQGIKSLQHYEITALSGKHYVLSCEAVSAHVTWNLEDMRFYRILGRILALVL